MFGVSDVPRGGLKLEKRTDVKVRSERDIRQSEARSQIGSTVPGSVQRDTRGRGRRGHARRSKEELLAELRKFCCALPRLSLENRFPVASQPLRLPWQRRGTIYAICAFANFNRDSEQSDGSFRLLSHNAPGPAAAALQHP